MTYRLYNASIKPIIVKQNCISTVLQPAEVTTIFSDSDEVSIKLYHIETDQLNIIWYILNEIFTLEQMRTILAVDGQYTIKALCDNPLIRIKDYEYIFEKDTSYQTFVFSSQEAYVSRDKLQIENRDAIMKKAKFLYLFGGNKTLFPLSGIATIASFIKIAFMTAIPAWYFIMTATLLFCFVWLGIRYIKSLKFLQKAMVENSIMQYMSSERKEYRKFSDNLVQKNLDINAGDGIYW